MLVGLLLSGLCLFYILRDISLADFVRIFSQLQPFSLLMVLLVFVANLLLRAVRWWLILKPIKYIEIKTCFWLTCIGYFFNNFIPARLGDVIKGVMLKSYQISAVHGIVTVLFERIMDTASLLLFFCTILLFTAVPIDISSVIGSGIILVGILTVFILTFIWMSVNQPSQVDFWLGKTIYRAVPKFKPMIRRFLGKVNTGFVLLRDGQGVSILVLLNLFIWSFEAFIPYFFLQSFNVDIGYTGCLLLVIVMAIASIVPAPGMIGVAQVVSVVFLHAYHVEKSVALSFSFAWNLSLYFLLSLLGLMGFFVLGVSFTQMKALLKEAEETES